MRPNTFRIIRRTELVPAGRGYIGEDEVTTQYLMKGSRILDTETVPQDVLIDLGCFGTTAWRSKWAYSHPELFVRKN